ncbi:hypothetical protein [Caballeronia mineralivorans]|nr:hypothetical protein [Caballeronia mineralivorans]
MRLLERQVAPRLERLGLEPYVGALGNLEGLFVNFTTMSTEHGLREFQLQLSVPDMALKSFATNIIKPHAVARCMQRNGVMSLMEIERETSTAFVFARAFRPLAMLEKWKQAAVPTSSGLFVGEMCDNDDIYLNTYIRPVISDRPSRWSKFAALFSTMPDWTTAQIHEGSDLLQWIIDHIRALRETAPLAERFPFLLDPYQGINDPLDATWNAAHASADAQMTSPPQPTNSK